MKKYIITGLALMGFAVASYGQGQIFFNNTSGSKIGTNSTAGAQSTAQPSNNYISGAGNYTFALFYNSVNNTAVTTPNVTGSTTPWTSAGQALGWLAATNLATSASSAGRFATAENGGVYSILPLAVGTYANLEIIAWNTAIGGSTLSSFESAYTAGAAGLYYGYSAVATTQLGDNGATIADSTPFGTPGNGLISGFVLAPLASVPEPSTMALAALGGASLLLFRRRK